MQLPPRIHTLARDAVIAALRARRVASVRLWRAIPATLHRPFEIVDAFDTWAYLSDLTAELSHLLERHGIEHLLLTDAILQRPHVIVRDEDAAQVRAALAKDASARQWWVAPSLTGLVGRARPARARVHRVAGRTGIVVSRNLVTATGLPLTHSELGVQVKFWTTLTEPTSSPGGGEYRAGTLVSPVQNGVLDHVGPDLWRDAQASGHRLPETVPHMLSVEEPVDLVYTWVDGDDPAWRARKAATLGTDLGDGNSIDAAIDARFENRDELKYSLRSVQMFANWAHHVWVVTDQQVPAWLREDERLTVVDHRQIFADPTALPVFNSHAIESQLHHIPGLADRYLYLNDDMLFGAPVRPEDFFHANGLSKFFTSQALIDISRHSEDDIAVSAAAKNNRDLIETEFGRTISNKLWHTPQPQSRPLLEEFEASHPGLFDDVMRSTFRHADNYSLPSSLSQYYAFASGRAVTGKVTYGYMDLSSERAELMLELWLLHRNQQCLCVNDSGGDDPATHQAKDAALRDFFEVYFPVASRWER
ncbi:MAG TPA: Stealth CR1 domain-containing protein [Propionicimonas sp.]|uniref:stealth family protein n=1 Tax=Propionicimonas sp. TaxID=1955623 RepID=UPI002F3FB6BE